MLHKIAEVIHCCGALLLYLLLAFSQMAQILYSYDTCWPVVSNISIYKYTFIKIQYAPFNLLRNLTWFYTSGMAFYPAFWDYIVMTGMTLVYFILLTGISTLWQLWLIAMSFYWWLKALYLFTLGDKPWRRPKHSSESDLDEPFRSFILASLEQSYASLRNYISLPQTNRTLFKNLSDSTDTPNTFDLCKNQQSCDIFEI